MRTDTTVYVPLGILMIAACLKKDHQLQVIDPLFEPINIASIVNFKPDIIGLSVMTFNYAKAKETIKILKEKIPDAKIVLGGIHPTTLPKETLEETKADFVVMGEGEETIIELCKELEKQKSKQNFENIKGIAFFKNNKVQINEKRPLIHDIDTLPAPAFELIDMRNYLIPPGFIRGLFLDRVGIIYASRGCPGKCIFCNSNALFGQRYRIKSVKKVIDEIKDLIKRYKIQGIYFGDETLTVNKNWIYEFCKEIKKLKIPWAGATRVTLVDEQVLRTMKKAGCVQLDFGVESGSERILKILKKGTTPEFIKRAFRYCKKAKIRSMATLMVGNPTETKEDIKKTIQLMKEIKPDFGLVSIVTPFPGTELYQMAIEKVGKNTKILEKAHHVVTSDRPIVNLSNISDRELINAKKRVQNSFMIRNYLSLISLHNMRYIINVGIILLLHPKKMINIFGSLIKNKRLDIFTYDVLHLYQTSIQKNIKNKGTGA